MAPGAVAAKAAAAAAGAAAGGEPGAPGGGRAARWKRALLRRGAAESGCGTGHLPFSQWGGELNEQNQRVIRADCDRTRAEHEFFRRGDVRAKMEAMLTCWCQQQQARYKQGLNEVLAPFLLLQSGPAAEAPTDDEVYLCFAAFLRRFAPFFDSDDFVPLQCAFVLFRRLLLYHRPDIHGRLSEGGVTPDMFCMPWFLTLFASKSPLKVTLQLWDRHLERADPPFFIFLAVGLLVHVEKAVLASEASVLPEVLTSLGLSSREDLETVWGLAEGLHSRTPASFASRLRRHALRPPRGGAAARGPPAEPKAAPGAARAGGGQEDPDDHEGAANRLERLERERCFFVLPEEVVGHCYPPSASEARRSWQPSPACPWRMVALDLRPQSAFEAARLPAALHFGPPAEGGGPGGGPAAAPRRRPSIWDAGAGGLDPLRVFMALKDALGEDWARDRETHVCLIGPAGDAQLAWALYEVLTEQLALRHVSVASGGFAAARACAVRLGLEAPPVGAGEARGGQPAEGAEEVGGALAGPPALRDRPGNWPGHVDMGELPSWPRKEICAKEGAYWQCIAVVVRSPQAQTVGAAPAALEWEGCASVLAVVGKRLVCAEAGASKQAAVYAEFEVSRVLKVTSKKQAPDVLIFYFREDERGQAAARASPGAGAAEPAMVLHFENGPDDVKAFIQVLKSSYSTALPQPVKTQEAAARGPARPAVAAVADQSLDEEEPAPRPSPLGAGLAAGAAAVSGPGRRGAA